MANLFANVAQRLARAPRPANQGSCTSAHVAMPRSGDDKSNSQGRGGRLSFGFAPKGIRGTGRSF